MNLNTGRSAQIVSVALISMVMTQIIYISMADSGAEINRPLIWTVEAVGFLAIAIFSGSLLGRAPRHSAAWAAIMAGGLLNVVQVGMGIAMFPPLKDAGEAMAPAFEAVLAGAFFLYFAGKALFGFASVTLGFVVAVREKGIGLILGWLAVIGGFVALVVNIYAMAVGGDIMYIAGAAGTFASLMLALVLGRVLSR